MGPTKVQRPRFHEGQILASDDLSLLLEYSREQNSRHERYLHTWGIADGLFVKEEAGEFVLQPGFAIDSSGTPIVVAKPIILDVDQLYDEALPSAQDDGKLFPLFIARTQEEQSGDELLHTCSIGGAKRIAEGATVRFRPFATDWDKQSSVDVSDGPSDNAESDRVVLVGFVEWNTDPRLPKGKIGKFLRRDDNNDIGPRYAGVAADEIVGRGGELNLRSNAPGTLGAPTITIGDYNSGKDQTAFAIGLDDGKGNINNLLTVDPKGNVHLKGSLQADGALKGQIRSGEVYIESGIASDGLTLPLPASIDPELVKKGEILVHAIVTPRIDPKADEDIDSDYLPAVVECDVDENRLVHCRIRWFKLPTEVPGTPSTLKFFPPIQVSGSVNYTIVASVAASNGGAQ